MHSFPIIIYIDGPYLERYRIDSLEEFFNFLKMKLCNCFYISFNELKTQLSKYRYFKIQDDGSFSKPNVIKKEKIELDEQFLIQCFEVAKKYIDQNIENKINKTELKISKLQNDIDKLNQYLIDIKKFKNKQLDNFPEYPDLGNIGKITN